MLNSARDIFLLLTIFQRKNLFVSTSSRTSLSLIESHVLCEINLTDGTPTRELLSRLPIDKKTLSRCVQGLTHQGMLDTRRVASDRRYTRVHLTEQGNVALKELDNNANTLLDTVSSSRSEDEVQRLSRYLLDLADALKAPPTQSRPKEHPMRPGLRRLARILDVIGGTQFDSEISSTHWQMLQCIHEQSECLTISNLGERLNMTQSTISRTVARLEEQGYIVKKFTEDDARQALLALSSHGQKLRVQIIDRGQVILEEGLKNCPSCSPETLVSMLEAFVFERQKSILFILEDTSVIHHVIDESHLQDARAFLVEELVQQTRHHQLSDTLLPPTDITLTLQREDTIHAVFSIGIKNNKAHLQCLIADEETRSSWRFYHFLQRSLAYLRKRNILLVKGFDTHCYSPPTYSIKWLSINASVIDLSTIPDY